MWDQRKALDAIQKYIDLHYQKSLANTELTIDKPWINLMWHESIELQQIEEQNADRERAEARKYDHDENVETTYERAAREYHEEVEQDIYERDARLGAI